MQMEHRTTAPPERDEEPGLHHRSCLSLYGFRPLLLIHPVSLDYRGCLCATCPPAWRWIIRPTTCGRSVNRDRLSCLINSCSSAQRPSPQAVGEIKWQKIYVRKSKGLKPRMPH